MELAVFNSVGRDEAIKALTPCLDISRWVETIVDARPFASVDELLRTANQAAEPFSPQEVESALAHHPRIGERPKAQTTEAAMSRSEQAGVDPNDDGTAAALADGNRAYEEKFGRVFLIRAAGRSAKEILSTLQERLTHTPEQEDTIVAEQLREIALLRLSGLVSEGANA
ncbi:MULTISPECIES: 2-oxo-4-hydroxy-4-carboxy-5-ureidoimidazoline decarboxylase [Paenarthrobacter]|jgi:2-oxo-4-hydroxy-4-carboxy-5-ureidoimidazoline decarboxylase|uniref:2-oxo-4-hydroxy-4-carboxy-5-ureidoimidazoline decarboxylase n=1 Tax=Paenarthrobacter TaxID=1742992 RepID=UPI001878D932|nr:MULTISPECIES: 2-oxo-4-hydroxy-4-carboxy-5-ureidoimidazoline decarboxylase [Paenarthrobacter]QOT15734.1 2-oxo-4-hydroxy-4-carboxy-5-ureidoimidazoline decarboxylase [Paenarthrobacter sp. YJN-5]UOD80735.1 2-oxo-4-hydroxy-4-carboxy-5-ureidoimidazoline decarboxylase [Paenarthrobacter ureafaciens]WNZ03394.1 2-oxo-4-hydroxy-4-carboxy-5-ureidoimidazoline decarboxylase [Paenarthrobacter ureafaciens]